MGMSGPEAFLNDKVALVTGATAGIGLVTARALARRGATVVLVGRDPARTAAAVDQVRRDSGHDAVESLLADLSSQADVRRLAGEFRARHDRLDILVNNAGAMFFERRESVDGIELTLALNHLAYFLLTNLLLEPLRAAAPSRVVVVASDAHRMVKGFNFDDPQGQRRYKGLRTYAQSKLANLLFAFELTRRLEGTRVTVNAVHPGFVATNFFDGIGRGKWLFRTLARLVAIDPEKGAATSIYVASSPDVEGLTGLYFEKSREARPSPAALDREAARRLWDLSAAWTKLGPGESA
jgi:retinol dehydrogenase-12